MKTLTDTEFLEQFENLTLPPAFFDHEGHIRLAWLYLQISDKHAEQLICEGIKRYAEHLGAPNKFHYTLTAGIVRIMKQRQSQQSLVSWQHFVAHNQDLMKNAPALLCQYYSQELLASEQARLEIMAPDLNSL